MKKKNKEELIVYMTNSLGQLRKSSDLCDKSNRTYNRMLINRAHMKKELSKEKGIVKIGSFIGKILKPKREKLICDYFSN